MTPSPSMTEFTLYFLRLGTVGFGGPIALARLYATRSCRGPRLGLFRTVQGRSGTGAVGARAARGTTRDLSRMGSRRRTGRNAGRRCVRDAVLSDGPCARRDVSAARRPSLDAGNVLRHRRGGDRNHRPERVQARKVNTLAGLALWAIFAVSALTTAWTESEVIWLFVLSGFVALAVRQATLHRSAAAVLPVWLISGLHGPTAGTTLAKLFWYFAEAGAFVFGSGLAIVPFLYGGVVRDFQWLTERQFLDAVAVAMITPGPVVVTVAFIGHLVGGPLGATLAALGVFLPCYLLVVIPAPYFRRFANNPRLKAFVDGVTAAATGAIAGAAFVLGKRAIIDVATALIAVGTLLVLLKMKRLPEPLVILVAGGVGLALHG